MKSLSNPEYAVIKMQGLVNILNALVNGWIGILRDSLSI